jgi:hypothetical protein
MPQGGLFRVGRNRGQAKSNHAVKCRADSTQLGVWLPAYGGCNRRLQPVCCPRRRPILVETSHEVQVLGDAAAIGGATRGATPHLGTGGRGLIILFISAGKCTFRAVCHAASS